MSSKPWHFVFFFIFNSYSHTHSNLKRASSIPKLFFFSHIFFLILSLATIPPQYFTLFKFTSSKPCLFFYMRFFFFFFKHEFDSRLFFLFFHCFVHTYFTITYTRHMLLKHGFDSQVFFLHIFYFTCSLLQLFFLHLKFFFFFTTRFFSLHTLRYYYYFFYSFLSFTQINS